MEEGYCEECLKKGRHVKGELHHIVHRSGTKCMKHIPINFKYLCLKHHTGEDGVHHNQLKDDQYKEELQLALIQLLEKEYYTHKELKELLQASDNSIKAITKNLRVYKEGFKRSQLIFKMMGSKNYLEGFDVRYDSWEIVRK